MLSRKPKQPTLRGQSQLAIACCCVVGLLYWTTGLWGIARQDAQSLEGAVSGEESITTTTAATTTIAPPTAKTPSPLSDVVELKVHLSEDEHMPLRIRLRPDLSGPSSATFVTQMRGRCTEACTFYRAENNFLLQGTMLQGKEGQGMQKSLQQEPEKGPCPRGVDFKADFPGRECFEHDPNCGCHGPIMTKGMVGWAGGGTGPDFFIVLSPTPVTFWAHDHTVWGEVEGDASLRVVERINSQPTHESGGLYMLDTPVRFEVLGTV